MIISGGENIYPSEIERAIFSLPQVADVVVVKGKHPQWGQTPKAVILLKPGQKLTEEQVSSQVARLGAQETQEDSFRQGYAAPQQARSTKRKSRRCTKKSRQAMIRDPSGLGNITLPLRDKVK